MNEDYPPSTASFLQRLKKRFFHMPIQSNDGLLQALKEAEENHIIDSHSRSLIEGTMQLENMEVRDVMVPKSKMVLIQNDISTKDLLAIMVKSSHSRFPVLSTQEDKVQGVILAKDLLDHLSSEKKTEFSFQEYLRQVVLVPESKTLGSLMRDFQQKHSHMAVVVDEYGEIAGLVTLEDILEQIVGEIEDEHDLEEDNIIDFGGDRFVIKANTPVEEFNAYFGSELQAEDVETVAGLVIAKLTYLPKKGDKIELQGFHFKVLKSDSRRLRSLEMVKK